MNINNILKIILLNLVVFALFTFCNNEEGERQRYDYNKIFIEVLNNDKVLNYVNNAKYNKDTTIIYWKEYPIKYKYIKNKYSQTCLITSDTSSIKIGKKNNMYLKESYIKNNRLFLIIKYSYEGLRINIEFKINNGNYSIANLEIIEE